MGPKHSNDEVADSLPVHLAAARGLASSSEASPTPVAGIRSTHYGCKPIPSPVAEGAIALLMEALLAFWGPKTELQYRCCQNT